MMVGDSLIEKISKAIDETDYVGVVLSKSSVKSKWVKKEVNIAMTHEIKGTRVKVLPILLESCKIPSYLRDKIYADFRNLANYEKELIRIVQRVAPRSATETKNMSVWIARSQTHAGKTTGLHPTPEDVLDLRGSAKLDALQRLSTEEDISSSLRMHDTDALLTLLREMMERLSLIHDYKQLETSRNLLTAIKVAPLSREYDIDKLRIFKMLHRYVRNPGKPLIGIDYFYEAILNSLDDLAIKEYVLKYGIVDDYVSDLENATSFEDAKIRAKVIALFANRLTKRQKIRIVSAILRQNQVLQSFGARSALRSVIETIRNDISEQQVKTLMDNNFLT
jgi:hypothetical protein